jgi:DNA-binding NarL/FixJ family response regulator
MKNKKAIALVEDDEEIRFVYTYVINQSTDFTCVAFTDSESFLASKPEQFDLVIMDVNLPGMTGIECTKILKQKNPSTLVMMFTIYENNERIFQALEAGADAYLLKESSPEIILRSIEELFSGGAPMSGSIAKKIIGHFQAAKPEKSNDFGLSTRESEILKLLAEGFRYQDIADKLFITFGTVRTHIYNIYQKLHVSNKTSAINKWKSL